MRLILKGVSGGALSVLYILQGALTSQTFNEHMFCRVFSLVKYVGVPKMLHENNSVEQFFIDVANVV